MYFIPFIRDYIEVLNNLYDSFANDISFQKILQETFIYLIQTFKFIIIYLLTFQWFRDLIYLPTLVPEISNSILKENFFLQTPLENFFTLFQLPTYHHNKFFIGFLNSFFLSLPFSCAHLIYLRRLLVQGNIAGITAGLGTILGQIFFIGSVTLGVRFIIIPWFSFEPLNYIIGLFLLINIVYDMVHERVIKIIDGNNKSILLKIFFLNFLLIWTEQGCLFQFLGNLTGGAEPTLLDSFASTSNSQFLVNHFSYLFGLFFGCIFFNFVFAIFFKKLSEYIQLKFALLRSTWVIRLNIILLSLIVTFSFSSIPFYGLDYLLTGPLGFISNDKGFEKTIFSQNDLRDPFGILGGLSDGFGLDTDVTSFDRGFYLKAPLYQTFEGLNYSGEYAATIRQGHIPLFDEYKTKARQIRDLIFKKDEIQKETQEEKSRQNINQRTNNENQNKDFEFPTYYPLDKKVYLSSNIQKRFEDNSKSNVVFESLLQASLNNVFNDEKYTVAYPNIENKLKEKYYSNPVYKFLLTIDIDSFLRRQPSNFLLSSQGEQDLYKKRLILGRYHDTLRFYNTLPYTDEFQYFFNGSKSFADRVYNQQFKGTLHVVKRLFSISFNPNQSEQSENFTQKVLKYDQPLFKNDNQGKIGIHEELEETNSLKSPFLEESNQNPLYIGWDESLKKIVITNRLLPKSITNFQNTDNLIKQSIEFTTWPINNEKIKNTRELSSTPLSDQVRANSKLLFDTKTTLQILNYNNLLPLFEYEDRASGVSYYQALPSNITKLATGIMDVIPPNRGGFIWPGHLSLKLSFADFFKS